MAVKKVIANNVVVVFPGSPVKHVLKKGDNETMCGISGEKTIIYKPEEGVGLGGQGGIAGLVGLCGDCFSALVGNSDALLSQGFKINKAP